MHTDQTIFSGRADAFAAHMQAHGLTPPPTLKADGRIHRFSTNGRRSDTAGGYLLHDDRQLGACGAFWDWRTGLFERWCDPEHARRRQRLSQAERQALDAHLTAAREQAARERSEAVRANARRIETWWSQARPLEDDDAAMRYLRGRGLVLPDTSPAYLATVLRLHPALDYWHPAEDGTPRSLGQFPTLLAAVHTGDGPDLRTVALHRTYLTPEGQKAPLPTAKKLTGTAGSLQGAAIRLCPPERVPAEAERLPGQPHPVQRLGAAEGIETALAAYIMWGIPTWSALSASGLQGLSWPDTVTHLHIFADNDAHEAGQRAARALARRAMSAGVVTRTHIPARPGADWADVLNDLHDEYQQTAWTVTARGVNPSPAPAPAPASALGPRS